MAATNLHKMTHLNGRKVMAEDVKSGLTVFYPSGLGGSVKLVCSHSADGYAIFRHTDGVREVFCELNCQDFGKSDFIRLAKAVQAVDCWNRKATEEDHNIISKADELGYVTVIGHTQVQWTEEGARLFKRIAFTDGVAK